eukprot:1160923-Pelagomonas_calceolata.AAC.4
MQRRGCVVCSTCSQVGCVELPECACLPACQCVNKSKQRKDGVVCSTCSQVDCVKLPVYACLPMQRKGGAACAQFADRWAAWSCLCMPGCLSMPVRGRMVCS